MMRPALTAELRLLPSAKADLREIWAYSFRKWGRRQADEYLRAIHDRMQWLSDHRKAGRMLDDSLAAYRKYSVRSHFIVYRLATSGIVVVRILHQRMDIEARLTDE